MTMENSKGVVVAGSTATMAGLLYDAAITGSVGVLDGLVQQYGKVIVSRFSLTSFSETPLHLAALLGHLQFSKRLLELRPELASEQDSEKCTPLHLAAANGHDQVVRELLETDKMACLMQDQEGRVPLHLAAMRGRAVVVMELLKPVQAHELLKKKTDDGDGVLHLCLKYNHLDVLKVVLQVIGEDREILMMTDSCGNTILHLAVMLKQRETVRFLFELPRVMAEMVNSMNNMGFTALEVLNNQSPLDYKSLMIREILIVGSGPLGSENIRLMSSHGGADPNKREGGGGAISETGIAVTDYTVEGEGEDQKAVQKCLMWARGCLDKLMDYRGDWMNETKGSLMMVSSIIATVTFSAAVAPPGGVWQEDTTKSVVMRRCRGNTRCAACSNESVCVAGAAVLRYLYPDSFIRFMKYDMIAFASSLVTVFLLISGFPLNNKFTLWILSLDMCVTITFLGLTFLEAIWLITPPTTYENNMYGKYFKYRSVSFVVWMIMIGIVGIFLLIRLCYWFKRPNKGARMMVMGKNHSPRLPESKC